MVATVGELLRDAAARLTERGSESPRLDAEVLLGHVLRVDRATLLAGPEASVGDGAAHQFEELVERRATGEPVSYIRGMKEFYGLALTVDPRALIPRPETETLVDLALARIGTLLTSAPRSADAPLRVWDVGTGSGAIIVAIAAESRRRGYSRDVRLYATDSSSEALSLAVENAVVHGVSDRIEFAKADLTEGPEFQPVDLLLANLPYIPTEMVPALPVAASFEPASALDGGPDGLAVVRRLIAQLPIVLKAGGTSLLEIGSDQAEPARHSAERLGDGWRIDIHDDLTARPRILEIERAEP